MRVLAAGDVGSIWAVAASFLQAVAHRAGGR